MLNNSRLRHVYRLARLHKKRHPRDQFSLRTLLAFVTAFCVMGFILREIGDETVAGIVKIGSLVIQSPARDSLPWLCVLGAMVVGALCGWGVYNLGLRWGFVALSAATCIGPTSFLISINVEVDLPTVELRDVSPHHVELVGAPYVCASMFLGTIIGFACLTLDERPSAGEYDAHKRRRARLNEQPALTTREHAAIDEQR